MPQRNSLSRLYDETTHATRVSTAPRAGDSPPIELIRGRTRVLAVQDLLIQLAALSGQVNDAQDLDYWLNSAYSLKKTPCLLLFRGEGGEPAVMGFAAAVLLYEYRVSFARTRVFATSDPTGRRTVFSSPGSRARVAARAARFLIESVHAHLAQVLFLSPSQDPRTQALAQAQLQGQVQGELALAHHSSRRWVFTERSIQSYLPLGPTFDQTLARIGRKTRINLRYYRRRTEQDLGCSFVADATLSLEELIAFNRQCMFPVTEDEVAARHRALYVVGHPLFCGIKDRDGQWLALVGGRRHPHEIQIDWQMNRDGLARYSISIVMRSFLIEHEVARGTDRLYMEGGTPQPIGLSFTKETVSELTVRRRTLSATLLTRYAHRFFPERNNLRRILLDPELEWRPW